MNQLTIQGRTYFGTSKAKQTGIKYFKGLIERRGGVTASAIEPESGPIGTFNKFIHFRMRDGRTRAQAIREFTRDFPEEHREFLTEYNRRFGRSV